MAEVFISYSRKDKDFVRKLGDALAEQKREAWIDWKDIPLTAEWQQEIFANIEAADNFIFVISPESASSANCRKEIDHAVANSKRLVPIFYRPVLDEAIPDALGKFQRIDFCGDDHFDSIFATLIKALDTDLGWVQTHTRLLTRAKEWERETKDSSFLLRGRDLREAERWIAKSAEKDPQPSTLHSQYILASRQAATKIQRIIIGAVAVAFLIAVALTIYAFREKNAAQLETATAQRNARESKARELAAFAIGSLREDPEKSIVLGMYAVNATLRFGEAPLPAAEDSLHQAILSSFVRLTLRGHTDVVSDVVFSPDGKRIATSSWDKTAKVWDATSGQLMLTMIGHTDKVSGVVFSPDGKRIATSSQDGTAKVWDANTGQEMLTLSGHSAGLWAVTFSADGKHIATASKDGTAKVWDGNTGRDLLTLRGHSDFVTGVAFSPDGKRLATVSGDLTAKVWNTVNGHVLMTLRGHAIAISGVIFSPDGKRIATSSYDNTAKVWDAVSGRQLLTLGDHSGWIDSVAFSPNGQQLATASCSGFGQVWDVTTDNAASGKQLRILRGHSDCVMAAAYSPDGKKLATASHDKTARVWNIVGGEELPTLANQSGIACMALSPDGRGLAIGDQDQTPDKTTTVWDTTSGVPLLTLRGHSVSVSSAVFSLDGKLLATADCHGTAKEWDAVTGHELLTFRGHSDCITGLAFSHDGRHLATASWDGTAKVWDAAGNEELTLHGDSQPVHDVVFSPDGRWLATSSRDGTVRKWDAVSGKELLNFRAASGFGVVVSPDGRRLSAYGLGPTKVWDLIKGTELTIPSEGSVLGAAFSPDGASLRLATVNPAVALWDVISGQRLLVLGGPNDFATKAAFSHDGKRVASAGSDGPVQLYSLDIRDLLDLARSRVTTNLTPDDCQRYFQSHSCPPLP